MKSIKIIIGLVTTAAGILLTCMLGSARRVTVKQHTVDVSPDADGKLTVFFISDTHRRRIPDRLLQKVRRAKEPVDLVIIGGDFAEKGVPAERVRNNSAQLAELAPIYYIWGNNDREIGEETIRTVLADAGGTILDNESVRIPNHPDWIISGADDPSSGNTNLTKALDFGAPFAYRIAAMHNPSSFGKLADMSSPALLVGGHTHGGQIRFGPFGLQPRGHFKKIGNRAELISNGFGTSLVPLRFGAPPETHLITLRYKKRSGSEQND